MSKMINQGVTKRSHAIAGCLVFFLMVPFYELLVFSSENKYNPINIILYFTSIIVVISATLSIIHRNIRGYNSFLLFYFFALFLNTLNGSTKQFLKTPEDLYFFLTSPLLLACVLYLFERSNVRVVHIKSPVTFNVNTVYLCFMITYVLLRLYIGAKVGFRLTSYSDTSAVQSGGNYTIPGISGIAAILKWLLVILIPYVKKRYAVIGVLSVVIMSGILHVKRGDIVRIMIFLLLYTSFLNIRSNQLGFKRAFYIVLGVSFLVFIFVQFGEYRLQARGGGGGIIIDYLGSRIDSVVFAWLYSYLAFSFEILKLYYDFVPSYEMHHVAEIFGANLQYEELGLNTTISGFNAATFVSSFILDFGYFYHLELLVFSLIAGVLLCLARKLDFVGVYLFICGLMALMVFGNYLLNRSMIMSILTAMAIFPFLRLGPTQFLPKPSCRK